MIKQAVFLVLELPEIAGSPHVDFADIELEFGSCATRGPVMILRQTTLDIFFVGIRAMSQFCYPPSELSSSLSLSSSISLSSVAEESSPVSSSEATSFTGSASATSLCESV